MAQYNLTDNVNDAFTFKLGELEYSFRYPTTKEMRELSVMNNDLQDLAKERTALQEKEVDGDDEKKQKATDIKKLDKQIEEQSAKSEAKMDELVSPVGHENKIGTVLEDMPVNVVRNFRSMMAKEINLG